MILNWPKPRLGFRREITILQHAGTSSRIRLHPKSRCLHLRHWDQTSNTWAALPNMGGGGGRGGRARTQRRHFRQNRENVWKRSKSDPSSDANNDNNNNNGNNDGNGGNRAWEPFATQNPTFDEYYKVFSQLCFCICRFVKVNCFSNLYVCMCIWIWMCVYICITFVGVCLWHQCWNMIFWIGFGAYCSFMCLSFWFFFDSVVFNAGARDSVPRRVGLIHGSS